ncbi:MAG: anion transporter [Gomphosphaeria aponina SAG 52.96 = DSM 107014]|uniref:Anion transporter n=1 Tax=Gomphosphaeria aponina SAG 52.96 = DSM 107014 TaxID=1521640 RepID=A0A941JSU6_9CHRO|nr:anion transporter [Gomphosphaeria aponina SAG 52.96 = DSM 107014]
MEKILQYIRYLVLAIAFLGLAIGKIPKFQMNRATIALIGSAFLIALNTLTLEEAWAAIDANTIVFLLSMMVINAYLSYAGFFHLALSFLIRLTNSPFGLITVLTFGSGFLSAFFLNDTIALIFTPLVLDLTQTLQLNPIPYLLAMVAATNLGSVATISGNPQNIIIGSLSQISYLEFSHALAPLALISLVIQLGFLWIFFPEIRSLKSLENLTIIQVQIFKPLLSKTLVITIILLFAFLLGAPLGKAALTAAALLLITRRIKPKKVFQEVDWNLLVMFSGLFILTEAIQKLNFLQFLNPGNSSWELLFSVAVLSNLISNVPAVLLMQPLIASSDTQSWLILAAGSTLAGNMTLFGSVANLIIVESAAKSGYKLTFFQHLRFGFPLTIVTLIIAYFWLEFGH